MSFGHFESGLSVLYFCCVTALNQFPVTYTGLHVISVPSLEHLTVEGAEREEKGKSMSYEVQSHFVFLNTALRKGPKEQNEN